MNGKGMEMKDLVGFVRMQNGCGGLDRDQKRSESASRRVGRSASRLVGEPTGYEDQHFHRGGFEQAVAMKGAGLGNETRKLLPR